MSDSLRPPPPRPGAPRTMTPPPDQSGLPRPPGPPGPPRLPPPPRPPLNAQQQVPVAPRSPAPRPLAPRPMNAAPMPRLPGPPRLPPPPRPVPDGQEKAPVPPRPLVPYGAPPGPPIGQPKSFEQNIVQNSTSPPPPPVVPNFVGVRPPPHPPKGALERERDENLSQLPASMDEKSSPSQSTVNIETLQENESFIMENDKEFVNASPPSVNIISIATIEDELEDISENVQQNTVESSDTEVVQSNEEHQDSNRDTIVPEGKVRRSVKFSEADESAKLVYGSSATSSASSATSSSSSSPIQFTGSNAMLAGDDELSTPVKLKKQRSTNSPQPVTVSKEFYDNLQAELQSAQDHILKDIRLLAEEMKGYRQQLEQSNVDELVNMIRKPPSASISLDISSKNNVSLCTSPVKIVYENDDDESWNPAEDNENFPSVSFSNTPMTPHNGLKKDKLKPKDIGGDELIAHDDTWKELMVVEDKKMSWADLREALQLRNTVLRATLGSGRSRQQQEDILLKVDKELSQPKKLKGLTNLDSASKMLEEYFQHREYSLLYRVAAYDEIMNKAVLDFPRQIQEMSEEIRGQFEHLRERQIRQNIRVLYEQELELIQALWEKKREHISQQEELKASLLAETLEWGLQKEEELYERYRHHESLNAVRSKYLDQVDTTLMQTYDQIFQRLQRDSPTRGIALEKMYDQLNAIRRGTLIWKQQYSRRLEDRLHNIELVIDGYYMSFMEELVEQLQELHKVNTQTTCYAEQLTSHLTSVALKVLDGGMKRSEQESFNNFMTFGKDSNDRKPLMKFGTSIRALATLADIPHDDTARLLTALLYTTTKDRVKGSSIRKERQVLFG